MERPNSAPCRHALDKALGLGRGSQTLNLEIMPLEEGHSQTPNG